MKGFGFVKNEARGGRTSSFQTRSACVDGDTVEVEIPILREGSPKAASSHPAARPHPSRVHRLGKTHDRYIAYAPCGREKVHVAPAKRKTEEGDRITCKVLDWNGEDNMVDAL